MLFEWNESKRQSNLLKHGVDFDDAVLAFDGRAHIEVHVVKNGEVRHARTVRLEDVMVTVVWTWRGGTRRLISARRARDAERRYYNAHVTR